MNKNNLKYNDDGTVDFIADLTNHKQTMEYKKLTLSEQLMVRMIARLMVLDPVFAEDSKEDVSEEVWELAKTFKKEMAE